MWSNDYASRHPSVSIQWQNKRERAWQKLLELIIDIQVLEGGHS